MTIEIDVEVHITFAGHTYSSRKMAYHPENIQEVAHYLSGALRNKARRLMQYSPPPYDLHFDKYEVSELEAAKRVAQEESDGMVTSGL